MSIIQWATPGTFTALLTTELNSLADQAGCNLGTEYDNRTNKYLFADVVGNLSFASNPVVGTSCELYLICKTDGTNYEDGSSSVRPPNSYIGSFVLRAASPQLIMMRGISLPPSKFKLTMYNNSGVALGGSGNIVSISPYNYETA